ncbi:MAG: hypothetical protein N3D12_00760 [Candidatus Methanomethyliaceae archaeon]|nr:hypothetical protein [Candidatus Methanomethyliaceae archaeon]
MRSVRRRYILFKSSGSIQEPLLLSYFRDKFKLKYAKIIYRKYPFIVLRTDHLSWESIRREKYSKLTIVSDTFRLESIVTSGTIRKIKEKIKALEALSSYGDEEAVPVKSEGKDVE